MSAVVPPPPPPPPSPTTTGQTSLPTLAVKELPAVLLQLPAGTRLEAVVTAVLGAGAIRLRLPQGAMVDAQVPFRLPEGAVLSLATPTSGLPTRLPMLAVNGRPLAAPSWVPQAAVQRPDLQPAPPNLERAGAEQAGPARGSVPQSGHGAAGAVSGPPSRSSDGSLLTLTLLRPVPDGSGPKPAAVPPPAPPQPGTPQPPSPAPVLQVAELPAGTTIAARIVSIQRPGETAPAPAGPAPAGPTPPTAEPSSKAAEPPPTLQPGAVLRGEVTGSASGGASVIRTHAGPLVMEATAILPKGSLVTLELIAGPVPPQALAAAPFASRAAVLGTHAWPALTEALSVLEGASSSLSRAAAGVVPRADGSLMANTLQFLSVLRSGGFAAWLGEAPSGALSRLRPELAKRIEDDVTQLGRASREAGVDGWRALAIPLLNGQQVDIIHLYLRQPETERSERHAEGGDRFVVDVRLSRLGRIQLDGLFRAKHKRLDLIVRSENPFTSQMRDDIRQIVHAAHEATGIDGQVSFQSNPPSFIDVTPEPAPGEPHGILV